jgi:hypothetical protein
MPGVGRGTPAGLGHSFGPARTGPDRDAFPTHLGRLPQLPRVGMSAGQRNGRAFLFGGHRRPEHPTYRPSRNTKSCAPVAPNTALLARIVPARAPFPPSLGPKDRHRVPAEKVIGRPADGWTCAAGAIPREEWDDFAYV